MTRGRGLGNSHSSVRWAIALAAAVLAALAGSMAWPAQAADEGLPAEGDYTAVYEGPYEFSVDGDVKESNEGTLTVRCKAGACQIEFPGLVDLEVEQASSLTFSDTFRIDPDCPGVSPVTTLTVEVTAATASFSETTEGAPFGDTCFPATTGDFPYYVRQFNGQLIELSQAEGEESPGTSSPAGPSGDGQGSATGGDDRGSVSRLDSGDAAAPSVLLALPRAQDLSVEADRTLVLAALVVILVLLIAFPTHLLNQAVDSGQEKLAAWRRRRRGLDEVEPTPVLTARTWAMAAGVVFLASLLNAFVDPEFGANAASGRMLISLFVALSVESLLVWFAVIWVTRRTDPDTVAGFAAAPATLLVVAGAVLITRLTGFEPGIVFGLVAGVTFATAATAVKQGKVALAGVGLVFVVAVLAWLGYSALAPTDTEPNVATILLTETLSSLAIAGIASLPLALIPLRGLPGHSIFAWSRSAWAVCYALGLVGFFLVLMPMPFSWAGVDTPLRTWVLLYLAYACVALLAWAAVAKPWTKQQEPADETATT